MTDRISRRRLLQGTYLVGIGALAACDAVSLPGLEAENADAAETAPTPQNASIQQGAAFQYEIQRTDDEWRTRLTPAEYRILREGGTERRNSHRFTRDARAGTYQCRGCDLTNYSSEQKIILDIGWVFFHHAMRDAVLLGTDGTEIEAHCRRCGSHLGHIQNVDGQILHCINGTALGFTPQDI